MSIMRPVRPEQAGSELSGVYEGLTKKFGKVPNIFGVMAHRPEALKHLLPFFNAVMAQGTVAPRYKELAYLKTSMLNGCEYCTKAHLASAKRVGITDEQVKAVQSYARSSQFDEKDKAVLLYAERITRGAAAMRQASIDALAQYFKEDEIVELTLVVCLANLTNRFNDALQVEPDLG